MHTQGGAGQVGKATGSIPAIRGPGWSEAPAVGHMDTPPPSSGAPPSTPLVSGEKWNISCRISKQRMSQSSAIAALPQEPVSPEETQEGKNTCHLAAIRLQPLPMVSPEETQEVKTQDTGPRQLRCTSTGSRLASSEQFSRDYLRCCFPGLKS